MTSFGSSNLTDFLQRENTSVPDGNSSSEYENYKSRELYELSVLTVISAIRLRLLIHYECFGQQRSLFAL